MKRFLRARTVVFTISMVVLTTLAASPGSTATWMIEDLNTTEPGEDAIRHRTYEDSAGGKHVLFAHWDGSVGTLEHIQYEGLDWTRRVIDTIGDEIRRADRSSVFETPDGRMHVLYNVRKIGGGYDLKHAAFDGKHWSMPTVVLYSPNTITDASFLPGPVTTSNGNIHFVAVNRSAPRVFELKHLEYNGITWSVHDVDVLDASARRDFCNALLPIALTRTPDDHLHIVYLEHENIGTSGESINFDLRRAEFDGVAWVQHPSIDFTNNPLCGNVIDARVHFMDSDGEFNMFYELGFSGPRTFKYVTSRNEWNPTQIDSLQDPRDDFIHSDRDLLRTSDGGWHFLYLKQDRDTSFPPLPDPGTSLMHVTPNGANVTVREAASPEFLLQNLSQILRPNGKLEVITTSKKCTISGSGCAIFEDLFVKHVTFNGATWSAKRLVTQYEGLSLSRSENGPLLRTSDGHLHLFTHGPIDDGNGRETRRSEFDGEDWTTADLSLGLFFGVRMSLESFEDSRGLQHFFLGSPSAGFYHAEWENGLWTISPTPLFFPPNGDPPGPANFNPLFEISDGSLQAFQISLSSPIDVSHFEYDGTSWFEELIDSVGRPDEDIDFQVQRNGDIFYLTYRWENFDSATRRNIGRLRQAIAIVSVAITRIEDLFALLDEIDGPNAVTSSLRDKLNAALDKLTDDNLSNDDTAASILGDFIKIVEAKQGKQISEADADELIAAAEEIIAWLEPA